MTKKQQIDWLCRLRSALVPLEMPKEWRINFDEALSDAIKALKYRTKVKCIVIDGEEFEIEQQNVGRWIPVSEELPPLRQHVLLSAYGRVIYGRLESEDGSSGYPLFKVCTSVGDSKPVYQETTVHSEFTTSRITAWMPLPQPYKAESEDAE